MRQPPSLLEGLTSLSETLRSVVDERSARILRHGLRVALCGSPNTGKSTLFNALLSEETRHRPPDVPGTTRDVLEGSFSLNGFQVLLMDTAGLRDSGDVVEQIGVQRARQVIDNADVALLLIGRDQAAQRQRAAIAGRRHALPPALCL